MDDNQVSQGEDVSENVSEAVETDTTDISSSENETASKAKESDSASGTEAEDESDRSVPYSRFKQVNEQARRAKELEAKVAELEAKLTQPSTTDPQAKAIKEQLDPILREMGYAPKADLEQEFKRQKEDEYVQSEIARLEKKYDGKDGRPTFDREEVISFALERQIGDVETAYEKMYQKELIDWHVRQALSKSKGIKTETSDGSGSATVSTEDADLKAAIGRGDRTALSTYLKRVGKRSGII